MTTYKLDKLGKDIDATLNQIDNLYDDYFFKVGEKYKWNSSETDLYFSAANGHVTSSSCDIKIPIIPPKNVSKINGIKLTKLYGNARVGNGYWLTYQVGGHDLLAKCSSYNALIKQNMIRIQLYLSSAATAFRNNTAYEFDICSIEFECT